MTRSNESIEPKMITTKQPPSPTDICELCVSHIRTIDEQIDVICEQIFNTGSKLDIQFPTSPLGYEDFHGDDQND